MAPEQKWVQQDTAQLKYEPKKIGDSVEGLYVKHDQTTINGEPVQRYYFQKDGKMTVVLGAIAIDNFMWNVSLRKMVKIEYAGKENPEAQQSMNKYHFFLGA